VAQFALENLRFGHRAGGEGGDQENTGFEHASLHEKRGAVTEGIRQMPVLDVCKHTGECQAVRSVGRFCVAGEAMGCFGL
ncbi:hypothetical protein ACM9HO_06330, partial [Pseudomonas sp. KHB2.9]